MEKRGDNLRRGIIIKGVGGLYTVRLFPEAALQDSVEDAVPGISAATEEWVLSPMKEETVLCRARGKFRLDGVVPLPGDDVLCIPAEQGMGQEENMPEGEEELLSPEMQSASYVIREILTRKNTLIRPSMANLSHLFVVLPCAAPAPDLLMTDKLTCIAANAGIQSILIINKSDMDSAECDRLTEIYTKAGFPVFPVSAVTGVGVNALEKYLWIEAGKCAGEGMPMRAAFAGVSGAGKSTLMTRLYPNLSLKTNTISRKIERGRHTTRHVELYPVTAVCSDKEPMHIYYLADTPGFSMLDFTRFNLLSLDALPESFPEFTECIGKCRYTKCTHTKEEGCAVLEKLHAGMIAPSRHENYVAIGLEIKKKPEWQRQKEKESVSERTMGKRPVHTGKRR